MSDTSREDALATLTDLIADHHVAMLTTIDDDGAPCSRPMGLQQPGDFDGTLYFLTRDHSEKLAHIARNPKVSVAFATPSDQEYVTMAGTATVENDRQTIRDLWSPPARAWFPDGPDDPTIRLIRVDVDRAEYWDSPASVVVHAIGLAKAALTGEPADDLGENEKVEL